MRVTLQQIADRAGVSRGTVDRALHNRGRVKPEVAERIRKIAEDMGYRRNQAGRALALSHMQIRIGVIAQGSETPFIQQILAGVEEEKTTVEAFGAEVLVRKLPLQNADHLLQAMEELKIQRCQGIALMPVEDERVIRAIRDLENEGITVVTFNTDLPDSDREYFVGENAEKSGRTAGGLMAEILPENSSVLVLSGYPSNHAHAKRTDAFREELRSDRSDIKEIEVCYNYDVNELTGRLVFEKLSANPSIRGIYLASAGLAGACAAVRSMGNSSVKIISNDITPENIGFLKNGEVRFLIGEDGRRQGMEPVRILFSILFDGVRPEEPYCYGNIAIWTKNNL